MSAAAGGLILVLSIYGMALEPADDPDADHETSDPTEADSEVSSRG